MIRLWIALAMAVLAACSVAAESPAARENDGPASLKPDIRGVFNKPMYRTAVWGLRVEDGGKVLVDINPGRQFLIGSVRKVFTVGELLDAVGSGHTYDTPVFRTGSVRGGVLHGNLIVVASGDLTMGGRKNRDGTIAVSSFDHNEANGLGNAVLTRPDPVAGYRWLARAVKAAGITRVSGEVIVDDRLFKSFNFRSEFNVKPIFVNDDMVDVSIVPGGAPGSVANLTWRPKSAALSIVNQLRVGKPGSKDTLAIDPFLPACIGSRNCSSTVKGTLPNNFTPPLTGQHVLVQTVRIVDPSNYARTVFVESLKGAGVTVDAPAVEANLSRLLPPKNAYRTAAQVARLTGMRYGQDAKLILKVSYNIGADTSLVLFGLTRGVNSMPAALAVERRNLASSLRHCEQPIPIL